MAAERKNPSFKPTPEGGRVASGGTGFGDFEFRVGPEAHGQQCSIVAPDGSVVGSAYIEIHEPEQPPARDAGPPPAPRGLGDTVAKFTGILGIKQCGGCRDRQEKLNRWFPYAGSRGRSESGSAG